jgi:hypothetical protein
MAIALLISLIEVPLKYLRTRTMYLSIMQAIDQNDSLEQPDMRGLLQRHQELASLINASVMA